MAVFRVLASSQSPSVFFPILLQKTVSKDKCRSVDELSTNSVNKALEENRTLITARENHPLALYFVYPLQTAQRKCSNTVTVFAKQMCIDSLDTLHVCAENVVRIM